MMTGSSCDCLVCQLEKNLIAELGDDRAGEEYRLLSASSAILSRFRNPLDLVRHLHTPGSSNHGASGDLTLLELLRFRRESGAFSIYRQILLLAFIPTIHRTKSQIAATFPALARDDIAQHAVTTLLEFLGSRELEARRSHIAFTIARKLRRLAFRWAMHELRVAPSGDRVRMEVGSTGDAQRPQTLDAHVLLHEFLDNCERARWLSSEERELLVSFKVEGVSCQELARRNGHSAVAIQHRIQRLLDRLRRLAKRRAGPWPEQLELFPR
jgi:DNA-directed RNA polymerase specialized sigma24 family protein